MQTRTLLKVKGNAIKNYTESIGINWTVLGKLMEIILLRLDPSHWAVF